MPACPGLDGGRMGHWGNQNEDTWRDDRWNQMDCGSVQCGIYQNGEQPVARAVCVRLGERGELSACFNPEKLKYEAVWQGGFVKFSPVRHGFVDAFSSNGESVRFEAAAPPAEAFKYRGYYRHGRKILFAYDLGDRHYLDVPDSQSCHFVHVVVL